MNTIISLVGRTKSGKSTLGTKLARYLRTAHIETSDVVKSISKLEDVEKLASTAERTKDDPDWLGKAIKEVIDKKLKAKDRTIVVLTGVREIEAVQYLRKHYDYWGFEVKSLVPIRFKRAREDERHLSPDQFIRSEIRELDMGIQQVEDDAPFAIPTSHVTDPDRLVQATVKLLRQKGVGLR